MKNVLMTAIFGLTLGITAHAKSIANFRNVLPNGIYQGTMMTDYKCQIKAQWLSSTTLKVETSLKYKNNKAQKDVAIFSDAKKAEFSYLRLNEAEITAKVSQSKVLSAEEDNEVVRYEQLSLDLNDSHQVKGIEIGVTDVNQHSDPSELVFILCDNIKKVK